jgi:hypothetical protein
MQRLPLGLEDRPAAVARLAGAGESPLPRRRVRLVELDRVVVRELLAGRMSRTATIHMWSPNAIGSQLGSHE